MSFGVVVLAFSVYVPMVLFDLVLQCYYVNKQPSNYDSRSLVEVVQEYRSSGKDAYPTIAPMNFFKHSELLLKYDILPLATGVSNSSNVYCREGHQWLVYNNDQYGFNNADIDWNSLVKTSADIVFIGDSFTQGGCVLGGKMFTDIIRKQNPKTLNLGVASTGPLLQKGIFEEFAKVVKPKVVFWCYYEGNDLKNLERERKWEHANRYLQKGYRQNLMMKQGQIDRMLQEFANTYIANVEKKELEPEYGPQYLRVKQISLTRMILLKNFRSYLNTVFHKNLFIFFTSKKEEMDMDVNLELFEDLLADTKETVHSWGGEFVFVYLPDRMVAYDKSQANRSAVLKILKSLEIPIIDLYLVFEQQAKPLKCYNVPWGKHFSVEGHRLTAEMLTSYLKKHDEEQQ